MTRRRALYLTQWASRSAMAGPPGEIARALADAGLEVAIAGGSPYDITTHTMDDDAKWYRRGRGATAGFPARTYPFFPGHSASVARRLAMYASFAGSSLGALPYMSQADVVVVYGSPATAANAALAATIVSGAPYVFIVQDVWPDSIFATGYLEGGRVRSISEAVLNPYLAMIYRRAGHILAISEPMRDLLVDRGVDPSRISVMYNWADESSGPEQVPVPQRIASEPLKILYAGNLGTAQRLDLVLEAVRQLPSEAVQLRLVGGGAAEVSLRRQVEELGLRNVTISGPVERSAVPRLIEDAHLNLVSLADDPLFEVTLPSKLQSLMSVGAPILSFAPGEVPRIVERAQCGLAARAGDPSSLAEVIRVAAGKPPDWFAEVGARGREYYFAQMSRQQGVAALSRAVDAAIATRSGRPRRRARGC